MGQEEGLKVWGDPPGDRLSRPERRGPRPPPLRGRAKQEATLRLDSDVIAESREGGNLVLFLRNSVMSPE